MLPKVGRSCTRDGGSGKEPGRAQESDENYLMESSIRRKRIEERTGRIVASTTVTALHRLEL